MTTHSIRVRWPLAVLAAVLLVGIGALTSYFALRGDDSSPPLATDAPVPTVPPRASPAILPGPLPDLVVPVSRELIERAGIKLVTVSRGASNSGLVAPGVIEPNAYKTVTVTPTAGGRITGVTGQLGEYVRRGHVLARIYSSDLADAQARYVSARAELEAHDREVARTEKLAEIGAASRQEVERIHAEHAERRAALQSAASQLRLLGASKQSLEGASTPEPTISVPSPLDGVITERTANVGQNVEPDASLFTVVDLSTVWVVADIYERDFSRVRVGTKAIVTVTAYPGLQIDGRVSYIDPRVNTSTRTAKVRVEVPNADRQLRLGMLVEVRFALEGADQVEIPRSSVQTVGDRSVVYLAKSDQPTEFVEREVRLGPSSGERIAIISGLNPGDIVVSDGSFHVRAERERLGLRSPSAAAAASHSAGPAQTAKIFVNDKGFRPSTVQLRSGIPARLTFVRTSDSTCATEIAVPSMNIRRELPLNQAVDLEFTPTSGQVAFSCGMNMFKGAITVR